jgi:hypothetical protein
MATLAMASGVWIFPAFPSRNRRLASAAQECAGRAGKALPF